MVQYSLSPQENMIKRGIHRIKKEIHQGVFVDIPFDIENMFDEIFYVKLSNCKVIDENNNLLEIYGNEVELDKFEVNIHEYEDGNKLFWLSSSQLKDIFDKYSIFRDEDLRLVIMSILPTSVRIADKKEFFEEQHRFFDNPV